MGLLPGVQPVGLPQHPADRRRRCHVPLDVVIKQLLHRLLALRVEGVGRRDHDRPADEIKGDDDVILGDPKIDESPEAGAPRKFYIDRDARVSISHEITQDLDAGGKLLTVTEFIDHTAGRVRSLCRDPSDLLDRWQNSKRREEIIAELESRGVSFEELAQATGHPEADAFDLLCHLAFNAPIRTRRERADRLRKNQQDFFDKYGPEAKSILLDLLAKYEEFGLAQIDIPAALKVPPISERGNIGEIIGFFGGPDQLRNAVTELQSLLYSAA